MVARSMDSATASPERMPPSRGSRRNGGSREGRERGRDPSIKGIGLGIARTGCRKDDADTSRASEALAEELAIGLEALEKKPGTDKADPSPAGASVPTATKIAPVRAATSARSGTGSSRGVYMMRPSTFALRAIS